MTKTIIFRLLVLIAALLGGSAPSFAQTGHPALDLGIARFALATGEPAMALRFTRDPETEHEQRVRARALLETGAERQAEALLDRLLNGTYYRGEAALLKASLVNSAADESGRRRELLQLAADKGHGDIRQQAKYQLAELARTNGRPDTAGQILASMESGYWAALGYMNIAADYGKRDLDPSRALIALRVAMAMAEEDLESTRGEALKGELLVRAGLLAYQSEDFDKAITFLEKVSLDSYSTPQGLYLHGLALSAKGNHRDAMQSWHRAKKYPLAFPGVAESWLGTGRGYDLTGYLGQAGEAFLAASATYESERVTLRKLAELVREKGAYEALVADAGESRAEWFLADSRMLTQPRSAYLLRFMEDASAQAAVQRVKTLKDLKAQMNRQAQTLTVFRSVLEERLASPDRLATDVARDLQARIETIRGQLVAARDRAAPGSYKQQQVQALAVTLRDLKTAADQLQPRLDQRASRLRRQLEEVARAKSLLAKSQQKADAALTKASADLDERVLAYVDQEASRMVASLEKAEQQIAHLYEYLALQNLQGGAR